jgi:5-oxoprolinase (ATP-hydrolysing) subunit A
MRIDLNADTGESFGPWRMGDDEGMMAAVTSASVACGFHAGDPSVMRRTVRLARDRGVAVGAHPGFPDLAGFGRRELQASPAEVADLVLYQIGALAGVASAEGVRLQHVKPHGALYHMAARDRRLADAIAAAVASFDPKLIVFGPFGSALLEACRAAGLPVASEAFADRAYESNGSLVPRSRPGALVTDVAQALARARRMIEERSVRAADGSEIALQADTLCVHGDTPGAAGLVAGLRLGLEAAGIRVAAPDG